MLRLHMTTQLGYGHPQAVQSAVAVESILRFIFSVNVSLPLAAQP